MSAAATPSKPGSACFRNRLSLPAVPVIIRAAEPRDLDALLGLLESLFSIEADFEFDASKQRAGLSLLIGGACVLAAEREGRVVGMCTVQTVISTAEGGPVGWVEDVAVAPDCAGQGIGRELLAQAEAWAAQHGLTRLQLLADRNNAPALGFYGHLGWSRTDLVALRKRPGPR